MYRISYQLPQLQQRLVFSVVLTSNESMYHSIIYIQQFQIIRSGFCRNLYFLFTLRYKDTQNSRQLHYTSQNCIPIQLTLHCNHYNQHMGWRNPLFVGLIMLYGDHQTNRLNQQPKELEHLQKHNKLHNFLGDEQDLSYLSSQCLGCQIQKSYKEFKPMLDYQEKTITMRESNQQSMAIEGIKKLVKKRQGWT